MRERYVSQSVCVSQWPNWLRRQDGELVICSSNPGYDTNFCLKNYNSYVVFLHSIEVRAIKLFASKFWGMELRTVWNCGGKLIFYCLQLKPNVTNTWRSLVKIFYWMANVRKRKLEISIYKMLRRNRICVEAINADRKVGLSNRSRNILCIVI